MYMYLFKQYLFARDNPAVNDLILDYDWTNITANILNTYTVDSNKFSCDVTWTLLRFIILCIAQWVSVVLLRAHTAVN